MKPLYLSLTVLSLLLPFVLRAQPQSAWGFSTEAGLGNTGYTDNLILEGKDEGSLVWNLGANGQYWWDLSARWSVAAGLGVRLQYYHLQSNQRLEAFRPLMGFEQRDAEDMFGLKRAEHAITSATGSIWGEYTFSRGRTHNFRLVGGFALQRPFLRNINTVYRQPTSAFESIFSFGTAGTFDRTASEPAINDYFRGQVPGWQTNLQGGLVLYLFSQRNSQEQLFFSLVYEYGFYPMSVGLSRPVRGLRVGIGARVTR